jgi:glucosamine--fructose-6-phosphate aminotransferase (isomerizing)
MCGIYGFVAPEKHGSDTVLTGLRYLEYRGYDSWGLAVADGGALSVEKEVGQIAGASTSLPSSRAALGHTRWATHGGVTQENAHPHLDCSGRFALIHNGIVENYRELGASLRRDHTFRSQTDTEVLVHLLEEAVETEDNLLQALLSVFRLVQGLSAVAVLDAVSGQIAVAKNGSPLVLGWAADGSYIASDPIALLDRTREVTFVEDGQAAWLTPDGMSLHAIPTGVRLTPEVRHVDWDAERAGLNGFQHYMAKEIHEQPAVMRAIAETKQEAARALAAAIRTASSTILIGCGTAYHAAQSARYMLAEIAGLSVAASAASELSPVLPSVGPGTLVIAFSQSGETIDVLEACREARARGARVAAVINAEGSALHRFADVPVLLGCGPERCVLATKSYTAKLAVMEMVAWELAGDIGRAVDRLRESSLRVEALLNRERVEGVVAETARLIAGDQHLFVLGRDRNYPLALEAALKIKEVTYMHAEGFASGELKHGVIALVTHGTPVVVLAPDHCYRREILAAAAEVRARGAVTIGLSPAAEPELDITLPICGGPSGPYEIAAATQLLAYETARLRDCDPDKPRNLAKSVTVK